MKPKKRLVRKSVSVEVFNETDINDLENRVVEKIMSFYNSATHPSGMSVTIAVRKIFREFKP
jgi:hypothetical protein